MVFEGANVLLKNSLLVSWVKRMIDGEGEAWMAIPSYYLLLVQQKCIK